MYLGNSVLADCSGLIDRLFEGKALSSGLDRVFVLREIATDL